MEVRAIKYKRCIHHNGRGIVCLLENFSNKSTWTEMYKAEVARKTKIKRLEFCKELLEIYEGIIN